MSKKVKSLILGLTKTQWRKIRRIADVHFIQLTTGAIIYLICPKTTIDPQAMAMIQSLYSRDPATILKHLIEVSEKGAEKFMAQFYVNYGHKSIGDCGNILIAVEGVSMIATKAIQDSQLYAGQEASTRYIDFSNQAFLDPSQGNIVIPIEIGNARNRAQILQENWRAFYMENLPLVQAYVMEQNPFEGFDFTEQLEKNPKTDTRALWKKTMYSRAFDIMRGFLPSGATTCVAWWTSISHAGDHLSWLRCHVLPEVSELALKTEELLKSVYPSSFTRKVDPNREAYKTMWYRDDYFLTKDNRGFNGGNYPREYLFDLHQNLSKHYKKYVLERPAGVELPWQIGEASVIRWTDLIDFGSFRDIQRHRAVVQRIGLITDDYGFHEWYLQNLPPDLVPKAERFIKNQLEEINSLGLDDNARQYFLPMGMKVPIQITGSLSKIVYLVELRCQNTVHPTLHAITFNFVEALRRNLAKNLEVGPEEIPFYISRKVGEISLKRGTQDIIKKEEVVN